MCWRLSLRTDPGRKGPISAISAAHEKERPSIVSQNGVAFRGDLW